MKSGTVESLYAIHSPFPVVCLLLLAWAGPAAPGAVHGISYNFSIIIKLIKKYSENRNVLSKLSLVFCSDYNGAPVKMVSSPTSP